MKKIYARSLHAAVGTLSLSALFAGMPAYCQTVQFDLPAQDAATGIPEFARQAGLQIIAPADELRGIRTHQVTGSMDTHMALRLLLNGTGLVIVSDDGRTISLRLGSGRLRSQAGGTEEGLATDHSSLEALEEVVVSAQKREERLQDVPLAVSVINTDQLASHGQVLLQDYFNNVPGLTVSPTGNGFQNLSIRGITQGGFENPTVGYLIDDVQFGSEAGGLHNSPPEIDPGDLERIEVLKGPQGTLYGASSMGGLVNMVTKDPSSERASGRFEVGTSNVYNGAEPGFVTRVSANLPLSDTWAARISGFRRQDPGYIDNPILGLRGVNEAETSGARIALLWRLSADFSLGIKALYQTREVNGAAEADVGTGLQDLQQNRIGGSGHEERSIQAYSVNIKAKLGSVDFVSLSGYGVTHYTNCYDYTPVLGVLAEPFGGSGTCYLSDFGNSKFTQEFRLSATALRNLDWLAGAYYTHEYSPGTLDFEARDSQTGTVLGDISHFHLPAGYAAYAGFADITYRLTDKLDLQGGGRETHLNVYQPLSYSTGPFASVTPPESTVANSFTYLGSLRYKPTIDLMMYARVASGFRPGSGTDHPSPTSLCVLEKVQCAVKPDTTRSYELGVKGDFLEHRMSLDASVYYIDWTSIQLSLRAPVTGFLYDGNGGGAKSEGVEIALTSRPFTGTTISGWVAFDNAVATTDFAQGKAGDRLPDSPRWSGNVSASQDFPLTSAWTAELGGMASLVGTRIGLFTSDLQRQPFPSYTKVDLHAAVKSDSWTINAYVNNVGDSRAVLDGGIGYTYPVVARVYIVPRTVGVSVVKSF